MAKRADAQPTENPHRDDKCAATWNGHVCTFAAGHKGLHHICFCSRRFFRVHPYTPTRAGAPCKVCGQADEHDFHRAAA